LDDIARLVPGAVDIEVHLGECSRIEQSIDGTDIVWRLNNSVMMSTIQFASQQHAKLIYSGSGTRVCDGGVNVAQAIVPLWPSWRPHKKGASQCERLFCCLFGGN